MPGSFSEGSATNLSSDTREAKKALTSIPERIRVAAEAEQPVTVSFDYEALASYLTVACDHVVPDEYAEQQGRITILGLG